MRGPLTEVFVHGQIQGLTKQQRPVVVFLAWMAGCLWFDCLMFPTISYMRCCWAADILFLSLIALLFLGLGVKRLGLPVSVTALVVTQLAFASGVACVWKFFFFWDSTLQALKNPLIAPFYLEGCLVCFIGISIVTLAVADGFLCYLLYTHPDDLL